MDNKPTMEKHIPHTRILWTEFRCQHCGELPPDFYGRDEKISEYYRLLFSVHEQILKGYGREISVTRGWSCGDHQLFIYLQKVRDKYGDLRGDRIIRVINDATMTPFSVHLYGALDLWPRPDGMEKMSKEQIREAVRRECPKIVAEARKAKPRPRIGGSYGTHVHVDLGFMIYPRYSAKLRPGAEW